MRSARSGRSWSEIRMKRGCDEALLAMLRARLLMSAVEYFVPQQTITHCQVGAA